MKMPRSHPFSRIILLLLIIGILYCTGCGVCAKNAPYIPPGRIVEQFIEDMPILHAEMLIATDNPRKIFLRVVGGVGGSCTERHETRQERDGNSIVIKMTNITTIRDMVLCTDVVIFKPEVVYLGILPPGDYKIIVNDVERQLRIE